MLIRKCISINKKHLSKYKLGIYHFLRTLYGETKNKSKLVNFCSSFLSYKTKAIDKIQVIHNVTLSQ